MSKYKGNTHVKLVRPQQSVFDLSHEKKITTRAGRLTPVFISEVIPSDRMRGNSEILVRVAPLLAPIYDRLQLFVHFFFVPNRLLWEDWETFITGGRLGPGSTDPVAAPIPPFVDIEEAMVVPSLFAKSELLDYLGMPLLADVNPNPAAWAGTSFDVMPALVYQKVWMDYYRDRNFIPDDFIQLPVASGVYNEYLSEPSLNVKTRSWVQDYFTSALPWTQRGDEVLMPLAGTGSVTYLETSNYYRADGSAPSSGAAAFAAVAGPVRGQLDDDNGDPTRVENIDTVTLDASSVAINDFRSAYALQVWLERNAVGGSRYNESTEAHFGVRPQDSRLQRAEYLGGGRMQIRIAEIVSTAYSDDGTATVPLANLAGHGITYGNTNYFNYFCPEHGFIIGIASIMSPPSYHQGMPRMFKRRTFLDYPWPTFARLGEQEVWKWELFTTPATLTEDTNGNFPLFGYQSRYAEWKQMWTTNHGEFRDTLKFWTLVREFGGVPELNETFTEYDPTVQDRIFAVNGGSDNFWLLVHNNVTVRRPLPYFGQPNTMGFA